MAAPPKNHSESRAGSLSGGYPQGFSLFTKDIDQPTAFTIFKTEEKPLTTLDSLSMGTVG